ncbi:MAG: glycosyltransferase [Phocaeicola sp.]
MMKEKLFPDYVFEASWEVCNKVGGIYTVLSTRAKTLQESLNNQLLFIGPDFWNGKENSLFQEDETLYKAWREHAIKNDGLKIRIGRWTIPGAPIAILVDFTPFFEQRNEIYGYMWEHFQVDSSRGYGDYDEASMFAYATGKVIESFYNFNLTETDKVLFQAHEWMTGMAALYLQKKVPQIATIFTTHATTIGRSIAGNHKPLYDYLFAYNGDQMSHELHVEAKHSIEKQTAHYSDCFTTVSDLTNNECRELLDKEADVVLVNGFEDDFVPKSADFDAKRKTAREKMLRLANCLLGVEMSKDTLIVGTSGRYEFKNKGIDVYLEAMNRLTRDGSLHKEVLALVEVPGWAGESRSDLRERIQSGKSYNTPLECPFITHWLHNMSHDQVLDMLKYLGMSNDASSKVKVIFIPCYLDGKDGLLDLEYYDLIIGHDLSIYPSYYEPWGYTPLESVAFHVPTITTDLAGFGLWANTVLGGRYGELKDGVKVIHRSDYNSSEVADVIKNTVSEYSNLSNKEIEKIRYNATTLAEKALWKHFIVNYYEAYDVALRKAQLRLSKINI